MALLSVTEKFAQDTLIEQYVYNTTDRAVSFRFQ